MYWSYLAAYLQRLEYTKRTYRSNGSHLILTSSNGTTTKLSVAPALHPVKIESCCVILDSPVKPI